MSCEPNTQLLDNVPMFLIWLFFLAVKLLNYRIWQIRFPSLSVIVHLLDPACFVRLVAYFTNTSKEVNIH